MRSKSLSVLVVVETTVLGLTAMGLFGFLLDRYDQARGLFDKQTAAVQATQMFIAMLTATPSTSTPTATATSTRTWTPTRTRTRTATLTRSPVPTGSPRPTQAAPPTPVPIATVRPTAVPVGPATPVATPVPSLPTLPAPPTAPPVPTVPPTPRPTRVPTQGAYTLVTQCGVIDDPGTYHLGTDLVAGADCIRMRTSYAILDCDGHSIRGTNFGGSGIAILKYGLLNSQVPAYVEVRNCHVSNFKYGIYVESGRMLVIHDNEASNNYDDTDPVSRYGIFLGMTEGGGIRVNYTSDSQIFGNITLHQAIGIDVRYSANVGVRFNTSSDNSAWGINLISTQNSEISSNSTADNVRKCVWGAGTVGYGCDAGGIVIQSGSSGNVITNNTVSGRNGNGIFIKAHAQPCGNNNSIVGNTITSVLYNSVELGFCSGNHVNGNVIRDGLDGVWLGFAHDTEIKNNSITNMRNHGIISSNSHNNIVSGNQVVNSNEGIYFYTEDYDRAAFSWLPQGDYVSHDNCLCANTLQNNTIAGIHLLDSTNNQVTNNTFQGNGRTVLVQGNGNGNNMQGNVGWYTPYDLGGMLARHFPGSWGP